MLIEEKPEEFASPEQNHENGSKKKKKKKKKKNNETLPQSNEHPQPQVSSAPLVVTPISEFKSIQEESNEPKPSLDATVSTELENKKEVEKTEVCAEFGETGSGKIKKRKSKSEKGKIGDVVVVENALNHDKEQVNSIIDRSKRQKCVQDGAQSNEHNVESAETAVQISVVDREVSPVDSIIGLNNQLNSENEHNVGPAETVVQMSVIDSEVSRVNFEPLVVTPISEFKSNEEAYAEFAKTQTGEIKKKKKKKKKKSVINGEESNEHNVGPAETAVQISVVDREVSPVDSIIGLNNQFNNENEHNVGPAETVVQTSVIDSEMSRVNSEPSVVTPISEFKSIEEAYAEFVKTQTGEIKKKKKKKSLINGEESNEHNVGPAETTVQMSVIDSEVSRVNSEPSVVTPISEFKSNEEAYAEFAKTQTGENKKKKKKKKKSVINGEESNEHNVGPAETTVHISVVDREVSPVDSTIRLTNQLNSDNEHNVGPAETVVQMSVVDSEVSRVNSKPSVVTPISEFKSNEEAYAEFAKTQTGEIKKKKKKKKKSVINGEESNEPKPSLDAAVSTEFENKKEVEKSEVYAEFAKTQTGEKTKRKSKSETGKMGEVVVAENVLNHDSEQVNEIDRRKRQKSVQDGAQSNEHNVEPAETTVQISVVDREVSPVDPTIRLNNQPANLVEQKDERRLSKEKYLELLKMRKIAKEEERKIRQENHLELLKMRKMAKEEERKIRQEKHLELLKMHKIAKEERKIRQEKQLELIEMQKKANEERNDGNKNKTQVESKDELKSTGEEKTNSGICWACREPNHSIKQCQKLKSLSKDEEICFFCGEIGHSLGKCSVYIAGEIKKKKRKKKSVINGEESNESKPLLDATVSIEFENKKEVEKSEVYAEFAKTQTGEKRKRKSKSETGKMGEVVVAENVLNHDSEQVNEIDRRKRQKSVQDGAQSNEHNVEPAETTVQISVVDREVSPVDPTIRLNNQPANLVEQKDERRLSKEKYLELLKMRKIAKEEERKIRQEKHLELLKMRKIAKEEERKIRQEKHLEQLKMHKIAKEERKISVVDREVSPVDPTIRLNNQPANLVEQKDERRLSKEKYLELLKMRKIAKEEERKIRQEKHLELLKMRKIAKEEERKIRQEKHLELLKMHKIAKEERKIAKEEERKIRQEKQLELIEMQKKANEERNDGNKNKTQVESKDELKSTGEEKTNSGICLACREPSHSIKQCQKLKSLSKDEEICFFCGEIGHSLGKCSVYIAGEIKKKKRKKKSVINGEESNESKPSLDATVSIEFENKKEVEKSEVYAEFPKTQTGEKRKRKSESETGKMGEVVLVENVLNHDSEQVNEIDRRKRQKSVHGGAKSNEHNVEPAETVVQISVVDREVSPVDPTIRLNNQPANLVEQKDERKISQEKELLKMHRKELRKIRQEKHLELRKMSKIAKEKRKIKRLELVKMQMKAKEELKSTGEEKINSGICWACREPNHSIKQCRKLKSLSKDEEICFFCGEIGHSLGKCSVYIAGGGRLARCLFCNLHGHFSYNCPGHGYFQGAVAGGS
ncbi:eukaryotic translation initiation factor 5B [Trifolium repens]|nr:eukaryotic translation initiation factor 5B [Trifolium repens]